MFTCTNSPASSTLSASSGEPDYPTHGLPLWDRYPSFSPLQVRGEPWSPSSAQPESEPWSPFQPAQVVPYNGITETPLSARSEPEDWSPPSAQPEQDTDDVKFPPHVLEHMDNTQLTSGYDVYYDPTAGSRFCQRQIEQMVNDFRSERRELEQRVQLLHRERLEQEKKQKDQEQLIEELQRTVKMLEKKERAQEKQLKGYRYRIGKRYNTRSGKN